MRSGRWVVGGWLAAAGLVLAPLTANAAPYAARIRWQPSPDADVAGYRLYMQTGTGSLVRLLDAGLPAPAADGTLSAVATALAPCVTHGFAVTAYRADGTESAPSNEIMLTYAAAAPLLDSDGDGLSNAAEDRNLDCIVEAGETDPDRADTDGDGVPDPLDLCQGTAAGAAVNASGCSCAQVVCDDGNACNGRETCVAGVCQPGVPLVCDDGNACTTDSCDATAGCRHVAIAGCTACTTASQCSDGNPCTTDTCSAGHCAHTAVADGTSCEDGLFCNGAEVCRAGTCTAGARVGCDDGNACTTDACSEQLRACTHTAIAGCTSCTTAAQCNDGNPCTTDSCAAGQCAHTAVADGTSCENGLYCDGAEVCRRGTCTAGVRVACDDGNACTTDTCSEQLRACTHTAVPGCTPCTTAADCNDANPCTVDMCGAGHCAHIPVVEGTSCDDGLFCNGAEVCRTGTCTAGAPIACDDGNACTTDACDETRRACTHAAIVCPDPGQCATATCDPASGCGTTPLPDGTPCDDGDVCTANDACNAGICTAGAPSAGAVPASAAVSGGATRLNVRTTATGLTLSARSWFPADGGFAAGVPDIHVTLRDGAGAVRLDTTVPGSAFVTTGGRAVYTEDHRAQGGGFTTVELRARGGRVSIVVRASVVDAKSAAPPLEQLRTGTTSSSTIDWAVRKGFQCVTGSGQCKGRGRRCR